MSRREHSQGFMQRQKARATAVRFAKGEMQPSEYRYWPRHNEKMVFKIQIPLIGNTLLMYAENHDMEHHLHPHQAILNAMKGDLKAYFMCVLKADTSKRNGYKVEIGPRVRDRSW